MKKVSNVDMLKAIAKHQKVERQKKARGKKKHFKNYAILRQFLEQSNKDQFNISEFSYWLSNNNVYQHKRLDVISTAREVMKYAGERVVKKSVAHMKKSDYTYYYEQDEVECVELTSKKEVDKQKVMGMMEEIRQIEDDLAKNSILYRIIVWIEMICQKFMKVGKKPLTTNGQTW